MQVDAFGVGELVDFVHDDDDGDFAGGEVGEHVAIEVGGANAGVDDEEDEAELLRLPEVVAQHAGEVLAFGFGGFGEAVAWEVDQVEAMIDVEEVDGLGAARLGAYTREAFLVGEIIEEG